MGKIKIVSTYNIYYLSEILLSVGILWVICSVSALRKNASGCLAFS